MSQPAKLIKLVDRAEQRSKRARILFIDIETFPNIGFTWGKYDQDVIRFKQQVCVATVAYKWQNGGVKAIALPDYKGYKGGSYDDKALVKDLWKLLDAADIVVAHNGDSFDIKVMQGRFLFHGLTPPSPFKTVDTKVLASKVARFNSNKLDDLSDLLFHERKIKTDFDLWDGCIRGDMKCWRQMVAYNKKDVVLLERLYERLRPYASNHPNVAVYAEAVVCPKCGSADIQYRGVTRTNTQVYQRFQCRGCGGWGRRTRCEKGRGTKLTHAVS